MFKFINKLIAIATIGAKSNNPTSYNMNKEVFEMARITEINGKYAIVNDGTVVATYARQRDARRGATRRGIVVA